MKLPIKSGQLFQRLARTLLTKMVKNVILVHVPCTQRVVILILQNAHLNFIYVYILAFVLLLGYCIHIKNNFTKGIHRISFLEKKLIFWYVYYITVNSQRRKCLDIMGVLRDKIVSVTSTFAAISLYVTSQISCKKVSLLAWCLKKKKNISDE